MAEVDFAVYMYVIMQNILCQWLLALCRLQWTLLKTSTLLLPWELRITSFANTKKMWKLLTSKLLDLQSLKWIH